MVKSLNVAAFGALISRISNYAGVVLSEEFVLTMERDVLNSVGIPEDERKVNLIPLFEAIRVKQKIEAIKVHRMLTGFGLKESKDAIESIWPHSD